MSDFDFTITSHCNAACPSCKRYPDYQKEYFNPNQQLHPNLRQLHVDFDDFKAIIERNKHNFKDKLVTYEGELGDALVHPQVESFIDYGCSVFGLLNLVTNGGVRSPSFYKKLGEKYRNLEITFSIDGMEDDTNQLYRRRVNTKRALLNMSTYANTKYGEGGTYWQFLLFDHNYFEVQDALEFSQLHNITLYLKFNQRPKFKISEKRKELATRSFEIHKHHKSTLSLGN